IAQLALRRGKLGRAFGVLDAEFCQRLAGAVLGNDARAAHRLVQLSSDIAVERGRHRSHLYEITTGPRLTASTSVARCRPSQASTSPSDRTTVPRSIIARWVCGAET